MIVVGETGLDDFITRLPATCRLTAAHWPGPPVCPAPARSVRCLASDAPTLTATLERIGRLARAALMGAPPLGLRKG